MTKGRINRLMESDSIGTTPRINNRIDTSIDNEEDDIDKVRKRIHKDIQMLFI